MRDTSALVSSGRGGDDFVGKEGKESSKESSSSSNNNNNNSEKKKKKTSVCWGLTAAVLIETAKIVYNKEPEFERDLLEGRVDLGLSRQ